MIAPHSMSVRKVDVRLPGKRNSNSHGARPVHLIITLIKWIRTSRLSIKILIAAHSNSVSVAVSSLVTRNVFFIELYN